MRWVDAHLEAMAMAADQQDKLGLDLFARVDVFHALHSSGLKLTFRPLTCAALYLPAAFGGKPGALINSQHPLAMQRFSGGHELGHHVFDHGPQLDVETEPRGSGAMMPAEEKLAEAFAAWFLMPPELVDIVVEDRLQLEHVRVPEEVYALALRLGASYSAVCVHLVSMKRAKKYEQDAWLNVPLKKLKMTLSTSPPAGGWKNDIWVLRTGDAERDLLVRAGDRLIVKLPGSWHAEELPSGLSTDDAPLDLLELADPSRPLVIDLAPNMQPRPVQLKVSDGKTSLSFTLVVEQPRHGLYVPPVSVLTP